MRGIVNPSSFIVLLIMKNKVSSNVFCVLVVDWISSNVKCILVVIKKYYETFMRVNNILIQMDCLCKRI